VSQHIGELETARAFETFKKTIDSFERLYEFEPEILACDLHPNYVSTHYAGGRDGLVHPVQHHYAHVLSCMADNDLQGLFWGGLGRDGLRPRSHVWGGEFLRVPGTGARPPVDKGSDAGPFGFERVAHLRTFRLPEMRKRSGAAPQRPGAPL